MKVILSGYYGFHNVGDEAILYSIISSLRKVNPEIEITVLSNDPEYTKETYGVEAVNRWKLKEVTAAIKESDGLISGGGSLLQDKTGNRSVAYYSGIMLIAKFYRKRFVVYAQGIGPIEKNFNQKIAKFALKKASFISVRDEESKNFLQRIGLKNDIELVPDPVLGIDVLNMENSWLAKTEFNNRPFLSVSVRDWPSEVQYLKFIAYALDKLSRLGYGVIFVPMHGEHDEKISCKVLSLMKTKADVAPYDLTIDEKITLIGKSDLLIGMRLHALIFAAVMDTPFTALSYDPKIDAFAKHCNQPVAAHVNEPNWNEETLYTIVKQQLDQLPSYTKKVQSYSHTAKLEAIKTAYITIEALKK